MQLTRVPACLLSGLDYWGALISAVLGTDPSGAMRLISFLTKLSLGDVSFASKIKSLGINLRANPKGKTHGRVFKRLLAVVDYRHAFDLEL